MGIINFIFFGVLTVCLVIMTASALMFATQPNEAIKKKQQLLSFIPVVILFLMAVGSFLATINPIFGFWS